MKKGLKSFLIVLIFALTSPLFIYAQEAPATPVDDPIITITQSELTQIITKYVNDAVDKAVAIAIKEERAKNIDLQLQLDKLGLDYKALDKEYSNYKKAAKRNYWLIGASSFTVGAGISLAFTLLLK